MDERIIEKNENRKNKKKLMLKKKLKVFYIMLFLSLLFVFIIDYFLVSVITVKGHSMENSYTVGNKILISKMNINKDNLHKGDVIYFRGRDNKEYIKRIIGCPGDVVEIVNYKVLVNGVQHKEDYIKGFKTEPYTQNKWFVGENEYFVLGDNRLKNSSKDSRIFGTINLKQIKGKVIYNFSSERSK